jgi:RimJ/RimL family protein N-acetyltransferase
MSFNSTFNPIFTGQHLRLAAPQPDDQASFAQWAQDDDYLRLLDDDPVRPGSGAQFAYFGEPPKPDDYYFHLRALEDDRLIGFVVLFNLKWRNQTAEMAIGIGERADRGRGYGRDALRLILNYAFAELCLHRVSLTVLGYNAAAIRAYERVGFRREGTHRQAVNRQGARHDLHLYGILREEWAMTLRD